MYAHILVPLEHSPYDEAILAHVRALASHCGARVTLIHVADGFAARNMRALRLRESEELRSDRDYLERRAAALVAAGIACDAVLAGGEPAAEILACAAREGCDLIAMATHGHGFLNDVVRGSVANTVRHKGTVPVLLVRGTPDGQPEPRA